MSEPGKETGPPTVQKVLTAYSASAAARAGIGNGVVSREDVIQEVLRGWLAKFQETFPLESIFDPKSEARRLMPLLVSSTIERLQYGSRTHPTETITDVSDPKHDEGLYEVIRMAIDVHRALMLLAPQQKRMVLRRFQGMSLEAVGGMEDPPINKQAAQRIIAEAIAMLSDPLESYNPESNSDAC